MLITYQYRCNPPPDQASTMEVWGELLRRHYNYALGLRLDCLRRTRCQIDRCSIVAEPIGEIPNQVDYYSQASQLRQTKELFGEYKNIYADCQQQNLMRLDTAWKRWLIPDKKGKRGGRPRFKKRGDICSLTHRAKSILDAAWGSFLNILQAVAVRRGKWAIGEDPRGTNIKCSGCGGRAEKTLKDRVHNCPDCRLVIDRDWNSGINILNRVKRKLGLTESWLWRIRGCSSCESAILNCEFGKPLLCCVSQLGGEDVTRLLLLKDAPTSSAARNPSNYSIRSR